MDVRLIVKMLALKGFLYEQKFPTIVGMTNKIIALHPIGIRGMKLHESQDQYSQGLCGNGAVANGSWMISSSKNWLFWAVTTIIFQPR